MPFDPQRVTDEIRDAYRRDGAVKVEAVFDQHWLEKLASGVANDVAEPGPLHTLQQSAHDPGYFLTDFCMSQRLPEFREFVTASPAAGLAAAMMGSSRISFFYDAIWVKGANTPKRSRWHQDQPYYPIDGDQFCVIWLALETLEKDVCLELLKGSHRWGKWFRPELTQHGKDLYEHSAYERLPDIESQRGDYEILRWDMAPGDCIVFHALTVHGAPGNRYADRWRRAVSTFWMGDDTVYAERPGDVRPLFEGHGLSYGDPMDSPYFPRVWPPDPTSDPAGSPRFTDPDFRISI